MLLVFVISGAPVYSSENKLAILVYHHILPSGINKNFKENGIVISLELFESHMKYLHDNGYHTVTSSELRDFVFNSKSLPQKSVMIHFDDGYLSNYIYAYPILKKYGFTATLFAITGIIQTKGQTFNPDELDMMSWMQIAASMDVFEIASHTNNLHNPDNNNKTALMTASIETAKADISLSLKRVPNDKVFAYPMGQNNQEIVDMLKNLGVDMAFTVNCGYVTPGCDPMRIKRITIYRDFNVSLLEKIVTCKYKY
jgi:peptidoglycan/xylan/chitin deacetylase (PgdA/CDA1 family)